MVLSIYGIVHSILMEKYMFEHFLRSIFLNESCIFKLTTAMAQLYSCTD